PPGSDEPAARAMSNLAKLFDDSPRTLARALRLLAVAGRGGEAERLADVALRPGIAAAAEAHLVLELGQGLRDADRPGLAAELLQRTLARPDVCELDRAKLGRVLPDITRRAGDRPGTVPPARPGERPLWTWLVRALGAADGFAEAAAVLANVNREADPLWYGHRAELLLASGRLDEARTEAETALRLADRAAPTDSVPARLALARVSLHRGDLATASDQLRLTERVLTGDATADRGRLDWTLTLFHAASGRPA